MKVLLKFFNGRNISNRSSYTRLITKIFAVLPTGKLQMSAYTAGLQISREVGSVTWASKVRKLDRIFRHLKVINEHGMKLEKAGH